MISSATLFAAMLKSPCKDEGIIRDDVVGHHVPERVGGEAAPFGSLGHLPVEVDAGDVGGVATLEGPPELKPRHQEAVDAVCVLEPASDDREVFMAHGGAERLPDAHSHRGLSQTIGPDKVEVPVAHPLLRRGVVVALLDCENPRR